MFGPQVHVPGPPQDLTAVPLSAKSILVRWRPPLVSEGHIQRYKLFYMEGDSGEERNVSTAETQYRLTDLEEYTEYSIWVLALNHNGQGDPTEEVVVRTLPDAPSEPPQNITLEAASLTVRSLLRSSYYADIVAHSRNIT